MIHAVSCVHSVPAFSGYNEMADLSEGRNGEVVNMVLQCLNTENTAALTCICSGS